MADTLLLISESGGGVFRISTGTLKNPGDFQRDKTIEISDQNPFMLWNLLYEMASLPIPRHPIETKPEKATRDDGEFMGMTGKQVIDEVYKRTGILITISPKSKERIVKKAKELIDLSQLPKNENIASPGIEPGCTA